MKERCENSLENPHGCTSHRGLRLALLPGSGCLIDLFAHLAALYTRPLEIIRYMSWDRLNRSFGISLS